MESSSNGIGAELDEMDLGLDEERILNEGVVEAGAVNQDLDNLEELDFQEGESPSIGNEVAILAHNKNTNNVPSTNANQADDKTEQESGESMEMEMMRVQMEEQKQMMKNMKNRQSMDSEKGGEASPISGGDYPQPQQPDRRVTTTGTVPDRRTSGGGGGGGGWISGMFGTRSN